MVLGRKKRTTVEGVLSRDVSLEDTVSIHFQN